MTLILPPQRHTCSPPQATPIDAAAPVGASWDCPDCGRVAVVISDDSMGVPHRTWVRARWSETARHRRRARRATRGDTPATVTEAAHRARSDAWALLTIAGYVAIVPDRAAVPGLLTAAIVAVLRYGRPTRGDSC